MKKNTKKLFALVLIVTLIISVLAPTYVNAQKIPTYNYERDGSFIKYKDDDGYYRYLGPTGNLPVEDIKPDTVISCVDDYYKAHNIRSKDIASTGSNNLPSSVDLSKNKYFPPVGSQGGFGSCATFSSVYYQFSYAVNENRDIQATAENTRTPQIVYNYISLGSNDGTTHMDNYAFLKLFGAPTMKEVWYKDQDQLNWHAFDGIWREGIRARLKDYFIYEELGLEDTQITSANDPDLVTIKTALNDGKVLGYSTYISSWKHTTLKTNPDAPGNNSHAGEEVIYACDGKQGGHAMAIVGYNDNIWSDINENNKVDAGEMGAFKIVNSWGDQYANHGFNWVAYDALNKVSAVEGCPFTNKHPIFEYIRSITVRDYNDLSDMYIQYTVNTARRNQHEVHFTAEKDGTIKKYQMFYGAGGGYKSEQNAFAFDGNPDTPSDGVFVCPLDNIDADFTYEDFESYNWSVEFKDTKEDSYPLIVKDVRLVNEVSGEIFKVADNLPSSIDGNSITYNLKDTTKNNKVIYYVGYDNPTLHYKIGNGEFKSVKLEENLERIGATHKYVLFDVTDDITLYFEGENGEIDNNDGKFYTASDRLNFFRTENARQKATITDIRIPEGCEDVGIRFFFETDIDGGYEPFNYQYTIENIETGESKLIAYDQTFEKSHVFYNAGKYNVTVEITDQTGDTSTLTKLIDVVDYPFKFESLEPDQKVMFVGDTANFTAKTICEEVISRGPQKSLYTFDVKDSNKNIVYTQTNKSSYSHMGYKKSIIDFEYIPEKAGTYTLTVSSTDGKTEYAETTIEYEVFDKIYGDSNADGEVSILDATHTQLYLAEIIEEEYIYFNLADCDLSNNIDILDATLIQCYLALLSNSGEVGKIIEYIPPVKPTEPPTQPPTQAPTVAPTDPPVVNNKVTFTNSFRWGGNISCYYWSGENSTMTSWPGAQMTSIGVNEYGESMYTFTVPQGATYIIFTNGSAQTTDISYSGGEIRYYPIADTDSKGHNLVKTW